MTHRTRRFFLFIFLVLGGCVNTDRTTFLNYGNNSSARNALMSAPAVSDGLAINYANSMQIIMRCNSTHSRIAREVSATAQIGLAAFGGVGAAFNYSATTLAVLGMGSAGIPQIQKIFDAKNRADVYNQAADMIQDGVFEYYDHNPSPPKDKFTPNGLTLVKKVSAAISLVDGALVGHLPSQAQMEHAVEAMSPDGTRKQIVGDPPVNSLKTALRATERVSREGAATGITDELPDDVKRDRRRMANWVYELDNAKDYARLRQFATDTKLPGTVKDEDLADSIRAMIRGATTREMIGALLNHASLSPGTGSDTIVKKKKAPINATPRQ